MASTCIFIVFCRNSQFSRIKMNEAYLCLLNKDLERIIFSTSTYVHTSIIVLLILLIMIIIIIIIIIIPYSTPHSRPVPTNQLLASQPLSHRPFSSKFRECEQNESIFAIVSFVHRDYRYKSVTPQIHHIA